MVSAQATHLIRPTHHRHDRDHRDHHRRHTTTQAPPPPVAVLFVWLCVDGGGGGGGGGGESVMRFGVEFFSVEAAVFLPSQGWYRADRMRCEHG